MTIQQSSTWLLNDANRRLQKTEHLLTCGKVKRAKSNIADSIAILNCALLSLKLEGEPKKRQGRIRHG
ncbi:hypothetical protein [Paenibacillus riograndensis]|uniref:Uncharacterized protein n=1 Tax=Paenibacillus riograndensis SBR5 TaxID=1073571 RepID=A0A0E4HAH1_9BACL|nr:hypothetical protein [Paenibacillus riograndensis]CQR55279.1 hypothetical protein PRIO_2876 [Paenibacillus riograndensis SBR5]